MYASLGHWTTSQTWQSDWTLMPSSPVPCWFSYGSCLFIAATTKDPAPQIWHHQKECRVITCWNRELPWASGLTVSNRCWVSFFSPSKFKTTHSASVSLLQHPRVGTVTIMFEKTLNIEILKMIALVNSFKLLKSCCLTYHCIAMPQD